MIFLSMILALSLQQLAQAPAQRPADAELLDWEGWVAQRVVSPGLQISITLLAPLSLLYWILHLFDGWLFGAFSLLGSAAVLFWALGREDYHTALERYEAHREAGDDEAGWLALQSLWTPLGVDRIVTGAADARIQCQQRLIYCGYQRWFAPLFYFLILGPVAAAAYRLVYLYAAAGKQDGYGALLHWLDWVPARLLALSFAVTGDFVAVLKSARPGRESDAPTLLQVTALASAGSEPGARGIRDLLYRTSGLWLVVASLLIIAI